MVSVAMRKVPEKCIKIFCNLLKIKKNKSASTLQDYDLYADWAVTTYSITYHLNGGTFLGASKSDYTIETATFTLSTPVKADTEFVGWTGTNLTESTKNVKVYLDDLRYE